MFKWNTTCVTHVMLSVNPLIVLVMLFFASPVRKLCGQLLLASCKTNWLKYINIHRNIGYFYPTLSKSLKSMTIVFNKIIPAKYTKTSVSCTSANKKFEGWVHCPFVSQWIMSNGKEISKTYIKNTNGYSCKTKTLLPFIIAHSYLT